MEKYFALIGHAIDYTLSREMFLAGFRETNVDADYIRFNILPSQFEKTIEGLKMMGFSGINVMAPYTETIFDYLDTLTPEARQCGVVNAIRIYNGQMIGHNTYGIGFIKAFEDKIKTFRGKRVVIMGAGGVARSIAFALINIGAEVIILDRRIDKAANLSKNLEKFGRTLYGALGSGKWVNNDMDILIQATSVGITQETLPISLQSIKKKTLMIDVTPFDTPFLKEAKNQGCQTFNGIDMFLQQNFYTWKHWFAVKPPMREMERAFRKSDRAFSLF